MDYNKRNVGIIGYWFATNYGGVASYYSLYRTIKGLDYRPFLVENPYFYTDKEGEDVFSRNLFKEIGADICEPYGIEDLEELNQKADTFILGSDQVLTTSSIRSFGKLFLMEFSDEEKRRIAVSASCGGDNLNADSNLIDYAKGQLQRFTKVSVREFSGVDTIKKKFGIKADFMIDPIFFTEAEHYRKIGEEVNLPQENEYVLAYILDPTNDKREGILKLAKTLGIEKKVILDGRKFTHEKNADTLNLQEDTLPELDFKQWLYYYSNASYVITDSFHGAAMALILNKPVIVYANYKRGYPRFVSLIRLFGIKSRLIESTNQITDELVRENINFENINRIITAHAEIARHWIMQAIESEKKDIRLPKMTVNALLERKKCVGCGACVSGCPKDAIQLISDEWGYYRAEVDADLCIDCGKCSRICPAIKLPEKRNSLMPECYEFIAKDEKILRNSSSGGAFTVMAKKVLESGGAVVGAAWKEDFSVEHIVVDSVDELHKLQKSKYLQSYIGNVFRAVKNRLESGQKILFTGCPCQNAGLKAYLGKEYSNLISVDILCSNAPSTDFFKTYLSEAFPDGIRKYEFRDKTYGYNCECIAIERISGDKAILRGAKEDAYQRVFHNHTMCAPHCENCIYQKLPRFGDLTMGDFWGISKKDKEIDASKGISVILSNNEKGTDFLKSISKDQYSVCRQVPLEWLGGNGYALNGSHNYASPKRDIFYNAIQKMRFSKAVDYALKPNHGIYNKLYNKSNMPLMLDSSLTRFSFDPNVWEEHMINGKITLLVRPNQWQVKRYANLSIAKPLLKGKEYTFSICFRIRTTSPLLNFHLRDSGTGCIQIIDSFRIPSNNNGSQWYTVTKKFIPDTEIYDQFMIGASQVSGSGNYFMIDYINIMEE